MKKICKGGKLTPAKRPDMHGIRTAVMIKGCWKIDRRSIAAQALFRWKKELVNQLGGLQEVSPAQMALIDLGTRTRLFIEALDAYLVGQKSLIDGKTRSTLPVLLQRQSMVDSLTKILKTLGLKRSEKSGRVLSLKEYWQQPIVETGEDGEGKESSAR